MAGQPPPVVEAEEDLVLHEARIDGGHALFELLVQLQLHPHADEDGSCIHHKPRHAAREELDTLSQYPDHFHGLRVKRSW